MRLRNLGGKIRDRTYRQVPEKAAKLKHLLEERLSASNQRFYLNLLSSRLAKAKGSYVPLSLPYLDAKINRFGDRDENSFYHYSGKLIDELRTRNAEDDFGRPIVRVIKRQEGGKPVATLEVARFAKQLSSRVGSVSDLLDQMPRSKFKLKLLSNDRGIGRLPARPLVTPALKYALRQGQESEITKWLKTL